MHSLSCITSWLPYITLCYIDSRFFLPLEQSRTALFGLLPRARLLVRNHAYPTPPQMSNGRVNHLGGEGRNGFDTLVNVHPSTKWLARFHHVVVFKTTVLHFKIENMKIRDTNGKRKFNRMLSFLFVDKRKLFAMKLSFEEFNLVFYTADRSAWLVLNQPRQRGF